MKIAIILFICLIVFSCVKKEKYFSPDNIINRTDEFTDNHEWIILNDKESIDGYTRIGDSIFGGEIACNIPPLEHVDIQTFSVYAGTKYAKDKNHVYYPQIIPCIDYEDCGVCYYGKIIIDGANPLYFEYLDKDYAKDDKNVFFRGEKINDADAYSFVVLNGPLYFYFAKDKNNVYKHGHLFKQADANTFTYDKDDPRNDLRLIQKYVIRDKDHIWLYSPPNLIKEIQE